MSVGLECTQDFKLKAFGLYHCPILNFRLSSPAWQVVCVARTCVLRSCWLLFVDTLEYFGKFLRSLLTTGKIRYLKKPIAPKTSTRCIKYFVPLRLLLPPQPTLSRNENFRPVFKVGRSKIELYGFWARAWSSLDILCYILHSLIFSRSLSFLDGWWDDEQILRISPLTVFPHGVEPYASTPQCVCELLDAIWRPG